MKCKLKAELTRQIFNQMVSENQVTTVWQLRFAGCAHIALKQTNQHRETPGNTVH